MPAAGPRHVCAFDELARRRGDYAMVGGGVLAEREGATIVNPRIALFSVGPTPVRARNAESEIAGKALDADTIAAAQRALDADIDPLDDAEIPAAMRRHLARVLLGRLLRKLGPADEHHGGRRPLTLTVNGAETERMVAPRTTLADFLRTDLELTATHVGCEMGACGACLVLLDGVPVHSCLVFAVQAQGSASRRWRAGGQRRAGAAPAGVP